MSGRKIKATPRDDFMLNAQTGAPQQIRLARAIDAVEFRSLILAVRFHAGTVQPNTTLTVIARSVSISEEEPQTLFEDSAPLISIPITANNVAPSLFHGSYVETTAASSAIGQYVSVVLQYNATVASPTQSVVTLSVDLIGRW